MKRLTEPVRKTVPNAWGRDVVVLLTDWEVEDSDVGRQKDHYLGHRHKTYQFTRGDVGRRIREDSSNLGSWYFHTLVPGEALTPAKPEQEAT